MKVLAPIAALAVLGGLIELSNSWRLRSWLERILWLAILAAVATLCVSLWLD
jgi:hypothetical protein